MPETEEVRESRSSKRTGTWRTEFGGGGARSERRPSPEVRDIKAERPRVGDGSASVVVVGLTAPDAERGWCPLASVESGARSGVGGARGGGRESSASSIVSGDGLSSSH